MRRANFVALGIGAIVTSAAAIGFNSTGSSEFAAAATAPTSMVEMLRTEASARSAQRARIEERYQAERAQCEALNGVRHDRCLINAHVHRGRALLEAAAPYQSRG
jgi:hypothetical protein